jgi:hypothetical protein
MRRRLFLALLGVLAPLGFFVPSMMPAAHAASGPSACLHVHVQVNSTVEDVQVPMGCAGS